MKGPRLLIWGLCAVLLAAGIIAVTRPAGPVRADVGQVEFERLAAQGARVVDVRTAGEFAIGHIAGAENVPLDTLTQVATGWDRARPVLLYCATGARSANAESWLAANGFQKVYNLTGGVAAWTGQLTKEAEPAVAVKPSIAGLPIMIQFYSDT
jgi:rhodanese-related sulfurtransferase